MKFAARLLFVLVLILAGQMDQAQSRSPTRRAVASAPEYVRVRDWAREKQFSLRWLDRDRTLLLSNRLARLTLTKNSSDAEINGVDVRLLFPVAPASDGLAVARLDLDKTFGPVLYPPKGKTGSPIDTICVDAGHGGDDPGEHLGRVEEKKYTLLLAKELGEQFARAGFNVVQTRAADKRVDLSDRTEIARRRKADVFIALHFNSSPVDRSGVQGIETYCLTPAGASSSNANGEGDKRPLAANSNDDKNMLLAYQLQKSLVRRLGVEDRNVKRARFQVLREATMPAVLIEGGFLSHPTEQKRIMDASYRRRMAQAIVSGVVEYKRAMN